MTVLIEPPDRTDEARLFTFVDRCDACGSQAFAKAIFSVTSAQSLDTMNERSLLFCGHHWTANRSEIGKMALSTYEELHLIGNR